MSRILKKRYIFNIGIVIYGCLLIYGFSRGNAIIVSCLFFTGLLFCFNLLVYKKIKNNADQFNSNGIIRNVDYLIIGVSCDYKHLLPEGATYIEIIAPNRSLIASYEILRHTHSILKDKGTIVILDGGNAKRVFTAFDVLYFHSITIKRMNLEYWNVFKYFPVLTNPFTSIKMIFFRNNKKTYIEKTCPSKEIIVFCKERELKLIYIKVNNRSHKKEKDNDLRIFE